MGEPLIRYDWCPYNKKFEHRPAPQGTPSEEGREGDASTRQRSPEMATPPQKPAGGMGQVPSPSSQGPAPGSVRACRSRCRTWGVSPWSGLALLPWPWLVPCWGDSCSSGCRRFLFTSARSKPVGEFLSPSAGLCVSPFLQAGKNLGEEL